MLSYAGLLPPLALWWTVLPVNIMGCRIMRRAERCPTSIRHMHFTKLPLQATDALPRVQSRLLAGEWSCGSHGFSGYPPRCVHRGGVGWVGQMFPCLEATFIHSCTNTVPPLLGSLHPVFAAHIPSISCSSAAPQEARGESTA